MQKNDNFTIIIDTREQQPWNFKNYELTSAKLDTGDYSIEGLQDFVTIERKKSVNEFANNITEKRFKDWIDRLSKIEFAFILLEFSINDVLKYPAGSGIPQKMWSRIKISPNYIIKNILEISMIYKIPVLFCDNHSNAEHMAEQILKRAYYTDKKRRKADET